MKFKRMNRVSVSEEIIEHIKELTIKKTLKPGDRLPTEEKMAAQMGVGRGTIREALKVLIYSGIIERENKSTFVSPNAMEKLYHKKVVENFKNHRDVMEMIEVRKILEPETAGLASERANAYVIQHIEEQYKKMIKAQDDVENFIKYDNRFHLQIVHASSNNLLIEIMSSIQKLMIKNQAVVLRGSKDIMPRSVAFHGKIFSAIKDRNKSLSRKHMLDHILDIEKEMHVIFNKEKKSVNGNL